MEKLEGLRTAVAAVSVTLGSGATPTGVTVSIGAASWPGDGLVVDQVVAAADARLYQAKRQGRNRTVGPASGERGTSDPRASTGG